MCKEVKRVGLGSRVATFHVCPRWFSSSPALLVESGKSHSPGRKRPSLFPCLGVVQGARIIYLATERHGAGIVGGAKVSRLLSRSAGTHRLLGDGPKVQMVYPSSSTNNSPPEPEGAEGEEETMRTCYAQSLIGCRAMQAFFGDIDGADRLGHWQAL